MLEDMELDPEELALMGITEDSRRLTPRPWGTTIEYLIDSPLEVGRTNIKTALRQIKEVVTCLTFKEIPNTTQNLFTKEFILFTSGQPGCFSQVGRELYNQPIHMIWYDCSPDYGMAGHTSLQVMAIL